MVDKAISESFTEGYYNIKGSKYLNVDSIVSTKDNILDDASSDFVFIKYYDNTYFIVSVKTGALLYANNDNLSSITVENRFLADQYRFKINKLDNGKYTIQSLSSNKYLNENLSFSKEKYEFELIEIKERKLLVY